MISRREWLGTTLGTGAALGFTPQLLRALERLQQPGMKLLQRAIPSTGEMVPMAGLSFSNHVSCADHAALKTVLETFAGNGGRVFDAMHGNASAEQFHIDSAVELGIQDKLFWSLRGFTPGPAGPQPTASTVTAQVDALLARTKRKSVDLVMLPVLGDPVWYGALKDEKKAKRVRYIGAQTIVASSQAAKLEALMRNEPLDFIGVDYDIGNRSVEETILPLARERKIGVIAFFPFGNNGGVSCGSGRNLFARVGNRPPPAWAAEFDATSWAQFFMKYVISHPAITVARVGTTKAAHMVDNMGGSVGRLPDAAMRKRMADFIDTIPAIPAPPPNPAQLPGLALPAAILDRYVGTYAATSGFTAVFRRESDRLWVEPGNNPEVPLNARSETRFQDPRGPIFEFRLDAQGNATGAVLEQQGAQGTQRLVLERK